MLHTQARQLSFLSPSKDFDKFFVLLEIVFLLFPLCLWVKRKKARGDKHRSNRTYSQLARTTKKVTFVYTKTTLDIYKGRCERFGFSSVCGSPEWQQRLAPDRLFPQLIVADNYVHPATDPVHFSLSLSLSETNTTPRKYDVEMRWKKPPWTQFVYVLSPEIQEQPCENMFYKTKLLWWWISLLHPRLYRSRLCIKSIKKKRRKNGIGGQSVSEEM